MADYLISALLEQLALIATREAEQEIRLVSGVDEEVRRLESNLRTVQAVLEDAEKRQVNERVVKLWLQNLKDVSYEMDDVLDEWNTAMIKLETKKEVEDEENAENDTCVNKKKVCSFIPSPSCCLRQLHKLVMHHDIAHKIKQLTGKLDEITKERERYGFELTRGAVQEFVERPKTTSFVDVSDICGRDKVRDDLVSTLLGKGSKEEEISPHIISLVGMGGIGKTTLAQLTYNHHQVKAHFEKRIWVCVSEPFDQCTVAKAIIQAFGGVDPTITELQSLLEKICDLIGGKKFFLILDDVWTEDDTKWVPFKEAFKYGSQGSRILVTTRNKRIADKIGSVEIINLEVLSEDDCWLIFRKIAFYHKDPTLCEQLENLGKKMAKKCKGLPLAAKTLGSLMRFKNSKEEWKSVLDSNLWELEDEEIKSLYAPLLLSYYDLSSPLRQCFTFCAVFPKDYRFSRDKLVFMWMAQGYIKSNVNMEIEIIARDYFENLAIRSFFQDFEKDEDDGNIMRCKMHDIVHDFAQLMSKNECFAINSNIELSFNYKTVRHLYCKIPVTAQFLKSIYRARNLRTLIVNELYYNASTLVQKFRCLRALTLEGNSLRESPNAVQNFIHLRYLNLVNYCGDRLPESICNLFNLQILSIQFVDKGFPLIRLPQGMGKLINLRHFTLDERYHSLSNVKFPRGFGSLTSLRTLKYFSLSGRDDGERCKLGELRNLNHLQGTLRINGLGSEVDEYEAENAQLKKKIGLHTLLLWFDEWDGEEIIREMDAIILNALEPPPNLEDLRIERYRGPTMFPNWMMSLSNLKRLYIYYLSLEHLPPLAKLQFLKSLSIEYVNRLKKVGVEFMGIEESAKKEKDDIKITLFPNLISLFFLRLNEWEEWNGIGGEEDCVIFTIMPRLQRLSIRKCPKLKSVPNFLRTTLLQKLEILDCQILEKRCESGTGEEWPKISHIPNIQIINYKPKMAHVKWSSTLASIEVPVPVEMSVTPHPYIYEFMYRVGCKLDEDEDQNDESNEDEVDKEEEDKGLQDKKKDDEVENL